MADNLQVRGGMQQDGFNIRFNLALISFVEDGMHIRYAPALDVYGYGATEAEAEESWEVSFQEFLRYTLHKGTLKSILQGLGWKIKGASRQLLLKPPDMAELLRRRPDVAGILEQPQTRQLTHSVSMPAAFIA